ncbi:MAG TPA: hypothetical protein VJT54_16635, partial [Verrucomicrobiae bacterium]|nr:hypothetical protein [Verrucomicrobiae bacterium]
DIILNLGGKRPREPKIKMVAVRKLAGLARCADRTAQRGIAYLRFVSMAYPAHRANGQRAFLT